MAVTETFQASRAPTDKLYLLSGQFTSTIRASQDVSGIDSNLFGISWDGTNTPWVGSGADKLYLQSGKFDSTVKTSEAIGGVDTIPTGISWDGTNTPWQGTQADKIYLQSGQFTSTLKTSRSVGGNAQGGIEAVREDTDSGPTAQVHTLWANSGTRKMFYESGQFTGTIRDSLDVLLVDNNISGISWDGENCPWSGRAADKLYLQSGRFTSTLKTSISAIGTDPTGTSHDDFDSRMGLIAPPETPTTPTIEVYPAIGGTGRVLKKGEYPFHWDIMEEPEPKPTRTLLEQLAELAGTLDFEPTKVSIPLLPEVTVQPKREVRQKVIITAKPIELTAIAELDVKAVYKPWSDAVWATKQLANGMKNQTLALLLSKLLD